MRKIIGIIGISGLGSLFLVAMITFSVMILKGPYWTHDIIDHIVVWGMWNTIIFGCMAIYGVPSHKEK